MTSSCSARSCLRRCPVAGRREWQPQRDTGCSKVEHVSIWDRTLQHEPKKKQNKGVVCRDRHRRLLDHRGSNKLLNKQTIHLFLTTVSWAKVKSVEVLYKSSIAVKCVLIFATQAYSARQPSVSCDIALLYYSSLFYSLRFIVMQISWFSHLLELPKSLFTGYFVKRKKNICQTSMKGIKLTIMLLNHLKFGHHNGMKLGCWIWVGPVKDSIIWLVKNKAFWLAYKLGQLLY